MNNTIINRNTDNLVSVSTSWINDERLDATAKGLMLLILSNKSDYILKITKLQKQSNLGRKRFNSAFKTLKEYGYIDMTSKNTHKGRVYDYIINETPNVNFKGYGATVKGYIYIHTRLDTGNPFYVGLSTTGKYKRANDFEGRSDEWKAVYNSTNIEVTIYEEDLNLKDLRETEMHLIAFYGRVDKMTGILVNKSDGGEGV